MNRQDDKEHRPLDNPELESYKPKSAIDRLRQGLAKTRDVFRRLLAARNDTEIEELLLSADVGVKASRLLAERVLTARDRRAALEQEIVNILKVSGSEVRVPGTELPAVVMVVGVNGSGKTTTVGKLCYFFGRQGLRVVVAAADTYRDAAAAQLSIWAGRAGVDIVLSAKGQDAAAVAYDAIAKARNRGMDVVLVDTAGRLHTRQDLMTEVEKVKRVCGKAREGAPDETWLVLDATVGQNGLRQAEAFHKRLNLTGIIIAKLDGTAKGGILIPIALELRIPIRFVGTGEGIEDLEPFDPRTYARALVGE